MSYYWSLQCKRCEVSLEPAVNHGRDALVEAVKAAGALWPLVGTKWWPVWPGLEGLRVGPFLMNHWGHGPFVVVSEYLDASIEVWPDAPSYRRDCLAFLVAEARKLSGELAEMAAEVK